MSLYSRIIKLANEQPWALAPETLAILADVLRFRASGARFTDDEIRARIQQYGAGGRPEATHNRYYDPDSDETFKPAFDSEGDFLGYRSESGTPMPAGRPLVAVIGVVGVIMKRADAFSEMSGATSIETLTRRFRTSMNDPNVRAIVFDVDSPGGGVYGVPEFAAEIRGARGVKPVLANSNNLAASAGYWILSAAEEASVAESGEVGSIGVYSLHQDISAYLEKEGVKYSFVSAGDYKTEGNPFEPLSDDARAHMQSRVDEYYDMFVKAVAKGRGASVAKVKSDFGQGRVLGAAQAKSAGMVDRIETLDETIRRAGGKKTSATTKAETLTSDPHSPPSANAAGRAAWAEINAAQAAALRLSIGLDN